MSNSENGKRYNFAGDNEKVAFEVPGPITEELLSMENGGELIGHLQQMTSSKTFEECAILNIDPEFETEPEMVGIIESKTKKAYWHIKVQIWENGMVRMIAEKK